jgi:condensin complex subunit 1
LVNKDKQNETIVEKLCLRFKNAEDRRLWRDIGFCLTLIPFSSEKSVKKLMDALPLYQDKLHEPLLYKYIQEIIAKVILFRDWTDILRKFIEVKENRSLRLETVI